VGRGVSFASRDALQATSLKDAVSRLDVAGYAGGLSVNLGRLSGEGETERYNVETSPQGTDVLEIPTDKDGNGAYYHTNLYLHNKAAADAGSQAHIESSKHRLTK